MKRITSFALACVVLFFSMAAPAAAAESVPDPWIHLLDHSFILDGSNSVPVNSKTFSLTVDLMSSCEVTNLDIVIDTPLVPSSVTYSSTPTGTRFPLQFEMIYDCNLLRIWSDNMTFSRSDSITLHFSFTDTVSVPNTLNFVRFDYCDVYCDYTYLNSRLVVIPGTQNQIVTSITGGASGTVEFYGIFDNIDVIFSPYRSYLYIDDWRYFDYLTVYFNTNVASVDSISAELGFIPVPITVSYLDFGNGGWRLWDSVGTIEFGTDDINHEAYFSVTVDLRSVDRTLENELTIDIAGTFDDRGIAPCHMTARNVRGYISPKTPSGLGYYFEKLGTWFADLKDSIQSGFTKLNNSVDTFKTNTIYWLEENFGAMQLGFLDVRNTLTTWGENIVAAIKGEDYTQDDQFSEDAESVVQENENLVDQITNNSPTIEVMDWDVSEIVGAWGGGVHTAGPILAAFIGDTVILYVFIISLTFMLLGYVLYGKR